MPNASQASFFDLDHTLFKVNSSFCFGMYLYRHGFFSSFRMLQLGLSYFLHKVGILPIATLHSNVFQHLFLGHPLIFFEQQVRSFLEENFQKMLYLPAIDRLKKAQAEGHFVAILSNSPNFLVKAIAQKLNVEQVEASVYGVNDNGCFSHIEHIVQGETKAAWVAMATEKLEIAKQNISVYSDSILDLPFMQNAGVAIGVNPDRKLRAVCQKYHWEII